jgi:hypothetical protein
MWSALPSRQLPLKEIPTLNLLLEIEISFD